MMRIVIVVHTRFLHSKCDTGHRINVIILFFSDNFASREHLVRVCQCRVCRRRFDQDEENANACIHKGASILRDSLSLIMSLAFAHLLDHLSLYSLSIVDVS